MQSNEILENIFNVNELCLNNHASKSDMRQEI